MEKSLVNKLLDSVFDEYKKELAKGRDTKKAWQFASSTRDASLLGKRHLDLLKIAIEEYRV